MASFVTKRIGVSDAGQIADRGHPVIRRVVVYPSAEFRLHRRHDSCISDNRRRIDFSDNPAISRSYDRCRRRTRSVQKRRWPQGRRDCFGCEIGDYYPRGTTNLGFMRPADHRSIPEADGFSLLVPERFNRIQPRRFVRGVDAEKQADGDRDAEADEDRPEGRGGGEGADFADD